MNLPHDVEQVLIGSLLGDGSVFVEGGGHKNAIFSEEHSVNQTGYLRWKAKIISNFFGGRVRVRQKRIKFNTCSSPILTEFRRKWYPNGKKIVLEGELQKLDALGLAVWYQDDGDYSYGGHLCRLSISSFDGQKTTVQEWFNRRWGLTPSLLMESGRYPRLQFSVKDSDKFLRLIAEHIHPSMIYKLGHLNPANKLQVAEGHRRHKESVRKSLRKWYWANHKKAIKQARDYRQKNRDEILQRRREYYWKNRDNILTRKRELYAFRKNKPKEVA